MPILPAACQPPRGPSFRRPVCACCLASPQSWPTTLATSCWSGPLSTPLQTAWVRLPGLLHLTQVASRLVSVDGTSARLVKRACCRELRPSSSARSSPRHVVMCPCGACAGLPPATLDDVTAAIVSGSKSELLGKLHVALLRLLHYDMEESHLLHQVLP